MLILNILIHDLNVYFSFRAKILKVVHLESCLCFFICFLFDYLLFSKTSNIKWIMRLLNAWSIIWMIRNVFPLRVFEAAALHACSVVSNSLGPYGLLCLIFQARELEWVAVSSSSESSIYRNRSQLSCITGKFLYCWAFRLTTWGWLLRWKKYWHLFWIFFHI